MARNQTPSELDEELDRRREKQFDRHLAVGSPDSGDTNPFPWSIAVVVFSPSLGFCWRLMILSFLSLYHYSLFVFRYIRRPRTNGLHAFQDPGTAVYSVLQLSGLVALLAWCLSMTPLHVFVPTAMDAWTPYAIHEPMRMTEILYDPGPRATIDIFAIHGLGSNPESAWTYTSNTTQVRWLTDLLPRAEGLESARVIMVNHQTRWDSNTASMDLIDYASELLGHIEEHHKANPSRPVIFIAHSFGGLLLKKALILAKSRSKDVAAATRAIIFLGVPHRGTEAAFVAACLSCMAFFRGSSSNLLQFMSVDNPEIIGLESEFYDGYVLTNYRGEPQPYIYDLVERRPERMGKLALGSIVQPNNGLLRHGRTSTLDTDHRGLNKFQSHKDPNFIKFLRIMSEAVDYTRDTDTSLPPEPRPPEVPTPILEGPQSEPAVTGTSDILGFASYGMPWTTRNRLVAAFVAACHEWVASWLSNDRNKHGAYFTNRVYKTAFYASVIGVSTGQAMSWVVFKIFEGCTSIEYRLLQILVSNITIVPLEAILHHTALALIAGARKASQVKATIQYSLHFHLKLFWSSALVCTIFAGIFLPPRTWTAFFVFGTFLLKTYVDSRIKKARRSALRNKHIGKLLGKLEKLDRDDEDPDNGPMADQRTGESEDRSNGSNDRPNGSDDVAAGSQLPRSQRRESLLKDIKVLLNST